jgi:hypothetical protein
MSATKALIALTFTLAAAVAVGGLLALALRPDNAAPNRPAPFKAAPPRPQQAQPLNCTSCTLPPVALCMPKGLDMNCQKCYAQSLNAAGLIPNRVIWNGKTWGYWALQGTNPPVPPKTVSDGSPYGFLFVELPECP